MVKHNFCIIIAQDALLKVPTFIIVYCIQNSKDEPDVCSNNSTELYPELEHALLSNQASDFGHLCKKYLCTNSELYSVMHL
jgi:hypothetical protein